MLLVELYFRGEVLAENLKHLPRHSCKYFHILRHSGSGLMEDSEVAGAEMKHRKR